MNYKKPLNKNEWFFQFRKAVVFNIYLKKDILWITILKKQILMREVY